MTAISSDPAADRAAGRTPTADDHQPAAEPRRRFSPTTVAMFQALYAVALGEQDPAERLRRFNHRRRLHAQVDELAKIQEDFAILDAKDAGMELADIGDELGITISTVETRLARARKRRAAQRS